MDWNTYMDESGKGDATVNLNPPYGHNPYYLVADYV
jgi:hypothetical protein